MKNLIVRLERFNNQMDSTNDIQTIAQIITDKYGFFDKDKFMVIVVIYFYSFIKPKVEESLIKELNVHIRKILGNGHSLASCIQFTQGKKGQSILKSIEQKPHNN